MLEVEFGIITLSFSVCLISNQRGHSRFFQLILHLSRPPANNQIVLYRNIAVSVKLRR